MSPADEQPDEPRNEDAPPEASQAAEEAAAETPEQPAAEEQVDAEGSVADEQPAAAKDEPAGEEEPRKRVRRPRRKQADTEDSSEEQPAKRARGKAAAEKAPAEKAAKAKAPAAAPRRKPGTAPRRRVVRAHARYVRTSARKARMVCGHLRGKSVTEARAILAFTPREAARDWSKLLESAVANAESNHELLEEDLIVREAYADEGPTIKRFRPRAMGRATPIAKRTSHLTIALAIRAEPVAANSRKRKKD